MLSYHIISTVSRVFLGLVLLFSLTACDSINNLFSGEGNGEQVETKDLSFAVAPRVGWMPWFLANEDGVFNKYQSQYGINIEFVADDYLNTISRFANQEVDAVAITNIDAIVQLVRQDIEADVIMIMGYSNGNQAVVVPGDEEANVVGKNFALTKYSSLHYLLDRFLIRNQIDFQQVSLLDLAATDIAEAFNSQQAYGAAVGNPNLVKLLRKNDGKVLFSTSDTPNEIMDLLVVRREVLLDHPNFANALLDAWFSVMKKLQGGRKGSTVNAMAELAQLSSDEFNEELNGFVLNDTPEKALSAIRADHVMRKSMRHIGYFVKRYGLENKTLVSESGNILFNEWVSYPGREEKLLHYNAKYLQKYASARLIY